VGGDGDPLVSDIAAQVLAEVRKAKTAAKRSMRWEVERVSVRGTPTQIEAFRLAADDVKEAGRIATIETEPADDLQVDVVLSEAELTG
jgi:valyl-tRNA synthetase